MREVFWRLFDIWDVIKGMTWQISVVILIILLCRPFVGKVSKQASYLLWAIVAIRLLCPVMIPSEFSIFNFVDESYFAKTSINLTDIVLQNDNLANIEDTDEITDVTLQGSGQGTMMSGQDNTLPVQNHTSSVQENISEETLLHAFQLNDQTIYSTYPTKGAYLWKTYPDFFLWLLGVGVMLGYGIVSYQRLKNKLVFATKSENGIFESSEISSPFVFGVFRPRIYMPYHLTEQEQTYILAHEQYHIKRRDYLVKLFAFGLLSIYWFHPLVWISFYLMSRDMEMSCDEQVLKELGMEERKAYSMLLLGFASKKRFPLPSPLAFGENDTKSRIKQILNYKKPTFWGIVIMMILVLVVIVSCLTDADNFSNNEKNASTENTVNNSAGNKTEKEILDFAETLYKAKTKYIGDVSADGTILRLLREHFEVETEINKGVMSEQTVTTYGTKLQTYSEPFWITLGFEGQPNHIAMYKVAAGFLALVENAAEFRWEYTSDDGKLYTRYVSTGDVEKALGIKNLKNYSNSAEQIAELLHLLEKNETEAPVSFLQNSAEKTEISWEILNLYERRLIVDGANYRGENIAVKDCYYEDFDKNGKMDFLLHVANEEFDSDWNSALYIYMNDDELYTHILPLYCWNVDVSSGDIDADGNTELVYIGFTGGNGGSGSYAKGILKYTDQLFRKMEMPGDFPLEELAIGDAGYEMEVYYGQERDAYEIVCPAIAERRIVNAEHTKDENGEYFYRCTPGMLVGANARGFYAMDIHKENGRDYLVAEQYLYGEGGINYGVGKARFIFDWNPDSGWYVIHFDVIAF